MVVDFFAIKTMIPATRHSLRCSVWSSYCVCRLSVRGRRTISYYNRNDLWM